MFTMAIFQGPQAMTTLQATGLLNRNLPISPDDLERFLHLDQSYAAIGYRDGAPCGYVVFCRRLMEEQTPELFILQVAGDGGSDWVNVGWEQIHTLAAKLGCRRIGAMLPWHRAKALARRFHLFPQGVYCTAFVRSGTSH